MTAEPQSENITSDQSVMEVKSWQADDANLGRSSRRTHTDPGRLSTVLQRVGLARSPVPETTPELTVPPGRTVSPAGDAPITKPSVRFAPTGSMPLRGYSSDAMHGLDGRTNPSEGGGNETRNLLERTGFRLVQSQGHSTIVRIESSSDTDEVVKAPTASQHLVCPTSPGPPPAVDQIIRSSKRKSVAVAKAQEENEKQEEDSEAAQEQGDGEDEQLLQWMVPQLAFSLTLGVLVGLATMLFHWATESVAEFHAQGTLSLAEFLPGPPRDGHDPWWRAVFGLYMTLGTCFSALLVNGISRCLVPECIGGGTIATKICLAVGAPVPLRVGIWRFALSAVYVGTGNALGVEAPMLHLCAAVASALHTTACLLSRQMPNLLTQRRAASLFTPEGLPQAVVLGCAASLSAAFGSPISAISYAVEEYVDVRQTSTVTALVLVSSVAATLVRSCFEDHAGLGALLFGGGPSTSDADLQASSSTMPWLLTATIVGIGLGTLSPAVMFTVLKVRGFCNSLDNARVEVLLAGGAGALAGAMSCVTFAVTGCASLGRVNQVGMKHVLDAGCARISNEHWVVLVAGFGKLLAFTACFGTGGAGGVLMPSLTLGAVVGRSVGHAVARHDSALPHAGAIFGMAALFGANMRLPLTAAGVALEVAAISSPSYDVRLICTIPLAAALATWVAAWWDPLSIFERMMLQDGIDPFTLSHQIQLMVHGPESGQVSPPARPQRESIGSNCSGAGPLMPPGRVTVNQKPGHSHRSAEILLAARRRSVVPSGSLSAASMCDSASFFSCPDEVMLAARGRRTIAVNRAAAIFQKRLEAEENMGRAADEHAQASCRHSAREDPDSESSVESTPSSCRSSMASLADVQPRSSSELPPSGREKFLTVPGSTGPARPRTGLASTAQAHLPGQTESPPSCSRERSDLQPRLRGSTPGPKRLQVVPYPS